MRTFKHKGYTINIIVDILEWGKEFYCIPEDAKISDLKNKEELEAECMGFAEPKGKEIWVFLPKKYDKKDASTTIAHEIGHCMKNRLRLPERKARHCEQFYQLVSEIAEMI